MYIFGQSLVISKCLECEIFTTIDIKVILHEVYERKYSTIQAKIIECLLNNIAFIRCLFRFLIRVILTNIAIS